MNKEELHGHMITFHQLKTNLGLGNFRSDWSIAMKFYCLGARISEAITTNSYVKWLRD